MRLTPKAGDEWPAHHHAQGSRGEPHASWPPKLRLQGQRSWSPKGALGRERECCTGSQSVGDAWGAAGGGWRQGCCARRTHWDGRAGPRRPTGLRPPLGCDGAAGRTHAQRGRAWAFVVSLVHYRLTFSDTDILVGPGHGESGLPGKTRCEGGAGGRPHTQPRQRPGEERGRRRAPDSRRSFPFRVASAVTSAARLAGQTRTSLPRDGHRDAGHALSAQPASRAAPLLLGLSKSRFLPQAAGDRRGAAKPSRAGRRSGAEVCATAGAPRPLPPVGDGMATSQQAASSEGLRLWALLSQGRTASTRYDSLLGQAGETVRASEHRRAPVSAGGAGPRGRACGTPNPGAPPGPGGHRHHLLLPLPLPLLRL